MAKVNTKTCYICGEPATSGEHAPPKCFFPVNQRTNLTKVPSCSVHNEETSKDDKYTRNIITMHLANNPVGLEHFLDKGVESFKKSIGLLKATTDIKQRAYYVDETDPQKEMKSTYAFQIDRSRVDLVLKKIAYATYHKKYGKVWDREILIGTESLRAENLGTDDLGMLIQSAKKLLANPIVFEGINPDVFQFSFLSANKEYSEDSILVMKFYDGFEAWAFPQPQTTSAKL